MSPEWRLRKAKTLVKLLALRDRHRLHRDLAVDLLWPDLEPAAATNNLHQAVHAARRALGGERDDGVEVVRLEEGVLALCPSGDLSVDVDTFMTAAAAARSSRQIDDYRSALALYTGELLPEDRYAEWRREYAERLEDTHESLLAGLGSALLAAGRPDEAIEHLEPLVKRRTAEEPLHRLLMQALDAGGRHWEALALYDRLRDALRDEFAAEPDAQTRALYRTLLSGVAPASPGGHNLPAWGTSFVGRRRELEELLALFDRTRCLTLSGPGGAGKTRLAIEAARRRANTGEHPHGVWLVDLSGVRESSLVPSATAAVLHLELRGERTLDALVDQLAARRLLLVLDNCEHLITACAELVRALLGSCPGISVLITSREPLHVQGETSWRVPSLDLPPLEESGEPSLLVRRESVQLFLERARDASPAFQLSEASAAAVGEICRRLDGIPLALELAAARVAHLAPAQIAARLDDTLTLLARQRGGVGDRQATLEATLEWSHELLDPGERSVLRRLAVFASGFSLEAAEHVCSGDCVQPVLVTLGQLVDKSLVVAERGDVEARYRLLEVVRQYAFGRLQHSGETAAVRARHMEWYAVHAAALDPELSPAVVAEPPTWFDVESDNLRAALATALNDAPGQALRMAVAMWRYWMERGQYAEGHRWLSSALSACHDATPLRARALFASALFSVRLARWTELPSLGQEIVDVGRQRKDAAALADALHQRTLLAWLSGDWKVVYGLSDEALEAARDVATVLTAHEHLRAILALGRSDVAEARASLQRASRALEEVARDAPPFFSVCSPGYPIDPGDPPVPILEETLFAARRVGLDQARAYILNSRSIAERIGERFTQAAALVDEALRLFRVLGDRTGEAHALAQRGHLMRVAGELEQARACFQSSMMLRAAIPDHRGVALAMTGLALVEATTGATDSARAMTEEAIATLAESGDRPGATGVTHNLAAVELLASRPEAARDAIERAFSLGGVPSTHVSMGWEHALLAHLRSVLGEHDTANEALATALDLFMAIGDRRGLAFAARLAERMSGIAAGAAKPTQRAAP